MISLMDSGAEKTHAKARKNRRSPPMKEMRLERFTNLYKEVVKLVAFSYLKDNDFFK